MKTIHTKNDYFNGIVEQLIKRCLDHNLAFKRVQEQLRNAAARRERRHLHHGFALLPILSERKGTVYVPSHEGLGDGRPVCAYQLYRPPRQWSDLS
jgi:hypothetical protein